MAVILIFLSDSRMPELTAFMFNVRGGHTLYAISCRRVRESEEDCMIC